MDPEGYDPALKALSGLISGKKRADTQFWTHAFEGMKVYLQRLDLTSELPQLSVIHVAGTKGKGSTCAMVESILRAAGYRTGLFTSPHLCDVRERIRLDGQLISKQLFTEHFWWVYNRLESRADGDYTTAAYFRFMTLLAFRVFLAEKVDVAILEVGLGGRLDATNCVPQPVVCGISALGYDHMELLGHTLKEIAGEKAGIFKAGVPAYTVPQPREAMQALEAAARRQETSLTVTRPLSEFTDSAQQPLELQLAGAHQEQNAALAVALAASWEGSERGGASLRTAPRKPAPMQNGTAALSNGHGSDYAVPLAMAIVSGEHGSATENAAAVQAGRLPAPYIHGLRNVVWPGRNQVVHETLESDGNSSAATVSFFLDGAHTPESMLTCARWFAHASGNDTPSASSAQQSAASAAPAQSPTQRVLVFNCTKDRDPATLLPVLAQSLHEQAVLPQHALFVPPDSSYTSLSRASKAAVDTSWQQQQCDAWNTQLLGLATAQSAPLELPSVPSLAIAQSSAHGPQRGHVVPTLAETLSWIRRRARQQPTLRLQVLVTGSLYLVGDVLRLLGKAPT